MLDAMAFRSAKGLFFEIGKSGEEYCLKNTYTEIPNEFAMYDPEEIEALFGKLLKICEHCEPVEETASPDVLSGEDKCFYAVLADGTEKLFRIPDDPDADPTDHLDTLAHYSEFNSQRLSTWTEENRLLAERLSLTRLRQVCRDKVEFFDMLMRILTATYADIDLQGVGSEENADGSVEIFETFDGEPAGGTILTILSDGRIFKPRGLPYLLLLMKHDVRVLR